MDSSIILLVVGIYFFVLLFVAWITGRKSDNESFFIGNKKSNWMLVAFGMIGTSLSGVTYISVPGTVWQQSMNYMAVVFGYFIGYIILAFVLLPLYYRLNLTSIYTYLGERFGIASHKTGAAFFLLSRTLGATLRLYLVVNVLYKFLIAGENDSGGFTFYFSLIAFFILLMILLYTFQGGVKTIVWTDTLQTTFMLGGLIVCVIYILRELNLGGGDALQALSDKGYLSFFNTDPTHPKFFVKQIIGGILITLTMTGLDQEMMQKNISVKTLGHSQKNMLSFSVVMVFVNFLFMVLGGLLYLYAFSKGATVELNEAGKDVLMLNGQNIGGDALFPTLAFEYLPPIISLVFIIGLVSALFPSADGAITALTSSFCIDILGMRKRQDWDEMRQKRIRQMVHLSVAAVFLVCVFIFKLVDNRNIIDFLLGIASYTYSPLLGLFAFGMFTRLHPREALVPVVCVAAPALGWAIDWLSGGAIGFAVLAMNGALVFTGLWIVSLFSAPPANQTPRL